MKIKDKVLTCHGEQGTIVRPWHDLGTFRGWCIEILFSAKGVNYDTVEPHLDTNLTLIETQDEIQLDILAD